MEMEPWLQTLLTILGTILASSGFWAYIQERSKRKAAENKHNNLETQMLIGLAHDRIIYLGKSTNLRFINQLTMLELEVRL